MPLWVLTGELEVLEAFPGTQFQTAQFSRHTGNENSFLLILETGFLKRSCQEALQSFPHPRCRSPRIPAPTPGASRSGLHPVFLPFPTPFGSHKDVTQDLLHMLAKCPPPDGSQPAPSALAGSPTPATDQYCSGPCWNRSMAGAKPGELHWQSRPLPRTGLLSELQPPRILVGARPSLTFAMRDTAYTS